MFRARRRGQSLVEFVLVLPLYMIVIVGTIDAVFLARDYMLFGNAVRESVRVATARRDLADAQRAAQDSYLETLTLANLDASRATFGQLLLEGTMGDGTIQASASYNAKILIPVPFFSDFTMNKTLEGQTIRYVQRN